MISDENLVVGEKFFNYKFFGEKLLLVLYFYKCSLFVIFENVKYFN